MIPRTRRGCKPCLGYRTKTEAAYALFSQGLSLREIAQRMGGDTTTKQVDSLLYVACKKVGEFAVAHVPVTEAVLSKLRPFAARRSMDAETLAVRLLSRCIEDGLVEAVLDDDA